MSTGSLPWGKAVGAWLWPPTPIWRRDWVWVGMYLCFPFGPSWPVLGWTLSLPLTNIYCHTLFITLSWICILLM